GVISVRNPSKSVSLLCLECVIGLIVAVSNILIVVILVMGARRLMKNHFYIVLSNLIVFTSLKGFVELAFILPYYIKQIDNAQQQVISSKTHLEKIYFSKPYEKFIFNVSVLADYGVLFFSVLIAINRYLAVARPSSVQDESRSFSIKTGLSCGIVWCFSAIIPLLYYFLDCQYIFNAQLHVYYNQCFNADDGLMILLYCLIYLSYACALAVLALYCLIFIFLRRKRKRATNIDTSSKATSSQLKLLRQSVVVFVLYAASIGVTFAISYVPKDGVDAVDLVFVENLLNLSIAAVYPICFLAMSGEMKK
ncbi:hypothetical protein PENTCL1PPCAC_15862, partial [Pristionchus entomophagus]